MSKERLAGSSRIREWRYRDEWRVKRKKGKEREGGGNLKEKGNPALTPLSLSAPPTDRHTHTIFHFHACAST